MDLSRYQTIILHVGGHDIDANISQTLFRQKFQAHLKSLDLVNCKVTVSGILPRRGLSIRPFNDSLRDLCMSLNVEFINNHDSFVMASGELPFDFFQTDRINLKFSGTRKLVQNMNRSCAILPIQHNKGFNGQTKPKALRKKHRWVQNKVSKAHAPFLLHGLGHCVWETAKSIDFDKWQIFCTKLAMQ